MPAAMAQSLWSKLPPRGLVANACRPRCRRLASLLEEADEGAAPAPANPTMMLIKGRDWVSAHFPTRVLGPLRSLLTPLAVEIGRAAASSTEGLLKPCESRDDLIQSHAYFHWVASFPREFVELPVPFLAPMPMWSIFVFFIQAKFACLRLLSNGAAISQGRDSIGCSVHVEGCHRPRSLRGDCCHVKIHL
jgi:hypothetical protein